MTKNKEQDKFTPPKEDIWDVNYNLTKAALSAVPTLGEFYEVVIRPPFQKRMLGWMETIAEACRKYEQINKDFKPENLVKNEVFISTFSQCSRIVVQTHQKEKLDTLKNALLNTVIKTDLNDDTINIFLEIIDSITLSHISVLKYFIKVYLQGEYESYTEHYKSYLEWENHLNFSSHIFEKMVEDLITNNLLQKSNYSPGIGQQKIRFTVSTTGLTKEFLDFIKTPEIKDA